MLYAFFNLIPHRSVSSFPLWEIDYIPKIFQAQQSWCFLCFLNAVHIHQTSDLSPPVMYALLNHCDLQGGMMEAGVMGVSSRASQDLFSPWVWFIIYPHGPGNSSNWDSILEWCDEVSCTFPDCVQEVSPQWNPIRLVSTEHHLILFKVYFVTALQDLHSCIRHT